MPTYAKASVGIVGMTAPNIRANQQKVGMTGFEPAASSSRTKRATGLRYIPCIHKTENVPVFSKLVIHFVVRLSG